jgi:hypothetical protein
MGSLLAVLAFAPPPSSAAAYALEIGAMAKIATFVLFPAMAATIFAGLLAIAVSPVFHNAGWAWAKAATGILLFEGGLHALGPLQAEAKRSASALAAPLDPATLASLFKSEESTLWILLGVSVANVALGVWRPRFTKPVG